MLKPVLTLWRHASKSWRPSPHRRRPELLFASNSSKALECLASELDIAWPLRDLWPVLSLVQGSERCLLIARSAMSRLIVHCVFHAVTILSCFFAWYSWIFLVHVRRLQLIRARWFLLESMKQRLCRVAWAGCFHGADHRFRIWVQWVPWSYKGRKVSPKYASRSKVWWIAKISAPKSWLVTIWLHTFNGLRHLQQISAAGAVYYRAPTSRRFVRVGSALLPSNSEQRAQLQDSRRKQQDKWHPVSSMCSVEVYQECQRVSSMISRKGYQRFMNYQRANRLGRLKAAPKPDWLHL
jgi:hypothetical protein